MGRQHQFSTVRRGLLQYRWRTWPPGLFKTFILSNNLIFWGSNFNVNVSNFNVNASNFNVNALIFSVPLKPLAVCS